MCAKMCLSVCRGAGLLRDAGLGPRVGVQRRGGARWCPPPPADATSGRCNDCVVPLWRVTRGMHARQGGARPRCVTSRGGSCTAWSEEVDVSGCRTAVLPWPWLTDVTF